MTLDRNFQSNRTSVKCDTCQKVFTQMATFEDWTARIVPRMKAMGWKFFHRGPASSDWEHTCPDCVSRSKQNLNQGELNL